MRRFEFQDGKSNKFWEIELDGSNFTVRWGKLGTGGQSQTKSFGDGALATREHDKLIQEKLGKGYRECGTPADPLQTPPPAPPEIARPLKGARQSKGAQQAEVAQKTEVAPVPEAAPKHPEPARMPSEIRWSEGWRRKILPWRGRPASKPAPDMKKVAARLQEVFGFARAQLDHKLEHSELDPAARKALKARSEMPAHQASTWNAPVEAGYLALLGHNDHAWDRAHEIGADMVHVWCQAVGPAFAVEALCLNFPLDAELKRCTRQYRGAFPYLGPWKTLRAYLASATAEEYGRAVQQARVDVEGGPLDLRRMLALAFPDEVEWVNQVVSDSLVQSAALAETGLMASVTEGEPFRQLADRLKGYLGSDFFHVNLLDYVPSALARMGLEALPGLLMLAEGATKAGDKRSMGDFLAQIDHPEVVKWFTARKTDKAIGPIAHGYLDRQVVADSGSPPVVSAAAERAAALPPLLANPPWLNPKPKKKLVPIQVQPRDYPERVHFSDKQLRELLARNKSESLATFEKMIEGFPERSPYLRFAERLCDLGQPEWAIQAFNSTDPTYWNIYSFRSEWDRTPERLLATFGTAVLPGLLAIAPLAPDLTYTALALVESPRLAATFAELRAGKKFRRLAQKWFKSFPEAALFGLIPAALGGGRPALDTLRWMASQGYEDAIQRQAEGYGVVDKVRDLLDYDPLQELPARMPALPEWWKPERWERPHLVGSGELPPEAVNPIGVMLALSKLDAPYAGLEQLKQLCDPVSLERFACSVYRAWLTAGGPTKEDWGFLVLAYFGGDQAARLLTPDLRRWPGDGLSARAALGLEVLAAIGTDVALMHLHGIALKIRFKALQDKAEAKIQQIAEERGLTGEELADRLVPDLDLDERGSRQLGTCSLTFDEHLQPHLRDEQGKPLKELPRSSPAEVVEAWKALKKDAKAVASTQIERLEQAMVGRRRWSPEQFEMFLSHHPLLGHLVRRLVWGIFHEGKLQSTFRMAEDRTYADVHDEPCGLRGEIGLVHPLEADLSPWAQVFADYQIVQPFAQIGRSVHRGRPADLRKYDESVARAGRILRLEKRGWKRGQMESGCVLEFVKRLSHGQAVVEIQEGGFVEELGRSDARLGKVSLPAEYDEVEFSEVVADLELVLA